MKNNLYNRMLMACAEWECSVLKEQSIILNKKKFDPTAAANCVYGQMFDLFDRKNAMEFKKEHGLKTGFNKHTTSSGDCTALEIVLIKLWELGQKERVYKIVGTFATWKDEPKENLFNLEE